MDLYNAFYNLAKINKIDLSKKANFNPHTIGLISKNLTLRDMIALSLTDKNMRNIMMPIIEKKRQELEELRVWLREITFPRYYTIEQLDQLSSLNLSFSVSGKVFPNLNLPNLKRLNLGNNQLTEFPTLNLPNLQYLFIDSNDLTELPDLNLPNLQILDLEDNPLPETEKARLRSIYGDKIIF